MVTRALPFSIIFNLTKNTKSVTLFNSINRDQLKTVLDFYLPQLNRSSKIDARYDTYMTQDPSLNFKPNLRIFIFVYDESSERSN